MKSLQKLLIEKISTISDENTLLKIDRLLKTGFAESAYQLNDEQASMIEESRAEIRTGRQDFKNSISTDPEILGGILVFAGTRVPIKNLFDYLETGESIEIFLQDFESVKKEQVIQVLELSKGLLNSQDTPVA
jgi:uncharacterized protein (DUF433 family)